MGKPEKMTGRGFRSHGIIVLLTLVIAGVAGCGYKTLPVPPEETVPQKITDLRYELDEHGVTLNWTYPEKTVRGDALTDIQSFQLFRAVVPADSYCDTCPVPFGTPTLLDGGAVVQGKARTGEYKATLLRPGNLYFFKLRSKSGWWAESADSNVVSFMWDVPPAAPHELAVTPGDGKIMLRWAAVTTRADGTVIKKAVQYQVFRSSGNGAFAPVGGLLPATEFVDDQVVNARTYRYKVQAVTMYEKGQVSGGVSSAVEAVPVDRMPPPVPSGVQGIRTTKGVKVVWEPVESPDLKGYRVYRRIPGSSPVLAGEVAADTTIFDDANPPAAESWFYSVTSIDRTQPANESRPSAEVEVRN